MIRSTLIFLLLILTGCSEVTQGLVSSKKVRVDKFYNDSRAFKDNNYQKFSLIKSSNNSSLNYKAIGEIVIKYFEKLGLTYDEKNPDFYILYYYGNSKSEHYATNILNNINPKNNKVSANTMEVNYYANYSYNPLSNASFIFSLFLYNKQQTKIFESDAFIKLSSYDIKNERYSNINNYIDCLIKASLYNNKENNYTNTFVNDSFFVLC